MFGWLRKKLGLESLEKRVKSSFSKAKKENEELRNDMSQVESHQSIQDKQIAKLEGAIAVILKSQSQEVSISPNRSHVVSHKKTKAFKRAIKRDKPVDIDNFTLKEKAIIKVLLDNEDMPLSYNDIAKVLNKSPNTIKCQIRSLKNKATILSEEIDKENNKRYRLKEKISIRKIV